LALPPLVGILVLVAAGCAPKHTFVLLPDPNGEVGRMTVSSAHGSQTLTRARESTRIREAGKPLTTPYTMRQRAVNAVFGDALKAQPEPPAKFTLYFITGGSKFTPSSQRDLARVVETVRKRQAVDVVIAGHTDTAGRREVNERLAAQRAADVAQLLVTHGVDRRILTVVSHGERFPLVRTADGVAEPRNRRVEITVR